MKLLLSVVLVGCGGTVVGPQVDASSDSAMTTDGGVDCNQVLRELTTAQTAAAQCCTTCKSPQCSQQIDGLCCPLIITDPVSDASKAAVAALEKTRSLGCGPRSCPSWQILGCSGKPTGVCTPNGICQQ